MSISRSRTYLALAFTTALLLSSCSTQGLVIQKVIDGDTVVLGNSETIRLLQIDSPELQEGECYAREARAELVAILEGSKKLKTTAIKELHTFDGLYLEQDPVSAPEDKYGRSLAYLFKDKLNVNLELVKRGAAAPYFFNGEKGKYFQEMLMAAEEAKSKNLGVWGACPAAVFDPMSGFSSGNLNSGVANSDDNTVVVTPGANCDPNYSGCIPMYPPDLDCSDIRALGLAPVHRIGADPHRLDRDGDGIGCEQK